jgi:DNA topoisomerase-3
LGFEQLPMLPDKFETKVVENSGIQKQFKIIKVYLTKPLVINCGDAGQEGELIHGS